MTGYKASWPRNYLPLTPVMGRKGDWRARALCAQYDPELWFDDTPQGERRALAICRECPVINECLADVLPDTWREGTAGGTTYAQRRAMRRRS